MAVLIEGMEMPKRDDEYVIFTVYGDGSVVYGPLNRPHVRYKNRAVHVPEPHGRLINADVLCNRLEITSRTSYEMREAIEYVAKWIVKYVPTVIPASGRRDEG